jgi:hypothetical protein
MDLSKLPKLSQTPKQADNAEPVSPEPEEPVVGYRSRRDDSDSSGDRADGYIALVVGAFLLFFFPRFLQWLSHRLFGSHFNPFIDPQGKVVPYTTVPEFWMDLGPVLFGLALVVEGLVVMVRPVRPLLWLVLGFTGVATAYNVIYFIVSYPRYGFAPISFLAGAFGIYACFQLWHRVAPAGRS